LNTLSQKQATPIAETVASPSGKVAAAAAAAASRAGHEPPPAKERVFFLERKKQRTFNLGGLTSASTARWRRCAKA
jgi:hypothetical protein